VRSHRATGCFRELVDRLHELWFRRVAVNIEDENPTRIEPGQPKLMSIVGKSGVVSFIPAID
jgi:hypothetical protein